MGWCEEREDERPDSATSGVSYCRRFSTLGNCVYDGYTSSDGHPYSIPRAHFDSRTHADTYPCADQYSHTHAFAGWLRRNHQDTAAHSYTRIEPVCYLDADPQRV